jgi:hypothetical protein
LDSGAGETLAVDPPADPAASSQDLFFPAAVFMLLDGEGFILQMQRVFTRIRSGAAAVATGGGACGSVISGGGSVHRRRPLSMICFEWLQVRGVKNPKGFGFYL